MVDGIKFNAIDKRGLRKFGFLMGGMIIFMFGLLFPYLLNATFPVWPWIIALVFVFCSLTVPEKLRIIYRVWMNFGLAMNKITTPLILGILFYIVITPIGMFMRFAKRDVLFQKYDETIKSYKIKSNPRTRESMERPF